MNKKTLNISYWVGTGLFALWIFADGIAGLTHAQAGVDSLQHLGYPAYLLTIFGVMKVLAAAAIVQNTFKTIKEWAFAGYAFNCLGAFGSHLLVRDPAFDTVLPLVFLAVMFIPYYLWKRRELNAAV